MTTDFLYEIEIKMHDVQTTLQFFDEKSMPGVDVSDSDYSSEQERTVEGTFEHAIFEYDDSIVKACGLLGEGFGSTTVFSFHAKSTAAKFYNAVVARNQITVVLNETQVICCSDYGFAIEQINENEITFRQFSRRDM